MEYLNIDQVQIKPEEIAAVMISAKTELAELYRITMGLLPEFKRQLMLMQADSESHMVTYSKVKKAVLEQPMNWTKNQFTPQVAKLMLEDMATKMGQYRDGSINKRYALTSIADVEKSLIEAKLYDALSTDNQELKSLIYAAKEESQNNSQKLRELALEIKG